MCKRISALLSSGPAFRKICLARTPTIGVALLLLAGPASAQPRPAHLPAINGVSFGATLRSARATLGTTFTSQGVKFQTVRGVGVIDGQAYDLSYVFRKANRLTEVYAKWNAGKVDSPSCTAFYQRALQGLAAKVGQPAEVEEHLQGPIPKADAKWLFGDGSEMDLSLHVYNGFCNLGISAATKDGQTYD